MDDDRLMAQMERMSVLILRALIADGVDADVAVAYVFAWLDAVERQIRRLPPASGI